jgi:hypothetical protein
LINKKYIEKTTKDVRFEGFFSLETRREDENKSGKFSK